MLKYKVQNGFSVSKLISLVDVDFIYSTNREGKYLLLNEPSFGDFKVSDIEVQKKNMKLIVINNDTLEMEVYNIPEEKMIDAFMNIGG